MLLAASCLFYMYFIPEYILILLLTIIIDYYAGIYLEKDTNYKKLYLYLSLAANIGILVVFKYYNFFTDNINTVFTLFKIQYNLPYLKMILPIGLSFHTFQAMSYTIEVYRGKSQAEHNFITYALYVMFYPQLVAGPIERPQNILPQFKIKQPFNAQLFKSGLLLMLWGLFKKVVIADNLSVVTAVMFSVPQNHTAVELMMGAYFFAIQIYCDFSGYSDIAIGAALTMGFSLMRNFNAPYFSSSISEFWSKWHISLSTWFKDYLYIPLGGNRKSKLLWIRNITLVFLISGLWHGASWCFIVWGALHAAYTLINIVTKKPVDKFTTYFSINTKSIVSKTISVFFIFNIVTFAWIFFRAPNLSTAFIYINRLWGFVGSPVQLVQNTANLVYLCFSTMGIALFTVLIAFFVTEYFIDFSILKTSKYKYYTLIMVLVMLIILMGKSEQEQFIYFQF